MFSLIYMKILESSPARYDRGISLLTMGAAQGTLHQLVDLNVRAGHRVLDIGCGTGEAAIRAAGRGASVVAFDSSASMLDIARERSADLPERGSIEYRVMGIAGLESLEAETFDVVTASLVMSELSPEERNYTLAGAHRLLKPGGRIIITDEVRPDRILPALIHYLLRLPLLVLTFLLTQTVTRPVANLDGELSALGFRDIEIRRSGLRSFAGLTATRAIAE